MAKFARSAAARFASAEMSDPITNAMSSIEKMLDNHAHASMEFPKPDPFEHGLQVGKYFGAQAALKILQDVLSADAEANAKL